MSTWPSVRTVTLDETADVPAPAPVRRRREPEAATLDGLSPRMYRAAWVAVADYLRGTSTATDAIPPAPRRALVARGLLGTNDGAPVCGPTRVLLDLAAAAAVERLTVERLDRVRAVATATELPQTVAVEVTVAGGLYFDVRHWAAMAFNVARLRPGSLGPYLTVLPATWWRGVPDGGEAC